MGAKPVSLRIKRGSVNGVLESGLLKVDSVQTQAILTSLQEQGIEDVYIEILKDIHGQFSDSISAQRE